MTEIEIYAKYYHDLGLNVTCIGNQITEINFHAPNMLKYPNHKWKHLFQERQSKEELDTYNWEDAVGVGTVMGYDRLVTIDIDGCSDYDFLDEVLVAIGLPTNYEWVMISGSNNGFHILLRDREDFRCFYEGRSPYDDQIIKRINRMCSVDKNREFEVVDTYPPSIQYESKVEKIELLWKTHLVLPPSYHKSGNRYRFLNCKVPTSLPLKIETDIYYVLEKFLKFKEGVGGEGYKDVFLIPLDLPNDINGREFLKKVSKPLICVLDIETDGLLVKTTPQTGYPSILQVAWIIMDTEGQVYKKESILIDDNALLENRALKINNKDLSIIKKIGQRPEEAYQQLISDMKFCKAVIAHNIDFDISILKHHISKYHLQDIFSQKELICTMKIGVDICKIEDYNGRYKYPKLTELFKTLYGHEVVQQHDAMADVLLTAKCIKALMKKDVIVINE